MLDDCNVHGNLICATDRGRTIGLIAHNGDSLAARYITSTRNTVQSASCETVERPPRDGTGGRPVTGAGQ